MIPYYPYILDDSTYLNSVEEDLRYSLWQVIYGSGLYDGLVTRAVNFDKIGKDSLCYYSELLYYFDLIEYLILMLETVQTNEAVCGGEDFDTIIASFNLDCVQSTLLCRYGRSGVVDSIKSELVGILTERLNLCCPVGEGISIMNINAPTCNTFTIYPEI